MPLPLARNMAAATRAMLVRSRLPRTQASWTGMSGSPRLAAIRRMLFSEPEPAMCPASRAVMASLQSM